MSVVATALRALAALGVTGEALFDAIERIERAAGEERACTLQQAVEIATKRADDDLAARKAKAAERTRKHREKKASNETSAAVTSPDVTEPPGDVTASDAPSRTRVVTLSSSLRSEGTQEANASFVDAPSAEPTPAEPKKPPTKPPKSQRGTRLPDDWEPSAEEFDLGRTAGLTDEEIHRAALEFRNYWCSRSRDAAKLSWRLTWHNRVIELGERKARNGSRMAAAAGKPGGSRRVAVSFADIYARRHGQAAD